MELQLQLGKASQDLAAGKFVVLFDSKDREDQADLVLHASFATPEKIALLRSEAGGLICLATDQPTAERLRLQFAADILRKSGVTNVYDKTPYGDPSPFSIAINHKDCFTGVTDEDRSLTAREFSKTVTESVEDFNARFKTPGHLNLLIGRGLEKRRGHTEMALKLCEKAGLPPAVLVCEMLGFGKNLTFKEIEEKALQNGWTFATGDDFK